GEEGRAAHRRPRGSGRGGPPPIDRARARRLSDLHRRSLHLGPGGAPPARDGGRGQRHGAGPHRGGPRRPHDRPLRTDAIGAERPLWGARPSSAEPHGTHGRHLGRRRLPGGRGGSGLKGLAVTIITRNEVDRLLPCLESVAWAQEIVVVDAESTDGTAELGRRFTPKVFVRAWPGFAAQKNFALSQATQPW